MNICHGISAVNINMGVPAQYSHYEIKEAHVEKIFLKNSCAAMGATAGSSLMQKFLRAKVFMCIHIYIYICTHNAKRVNKRE
jgi:hypothetical protein